VLEVDDASEYSALLLPNPSRLIIDIHGKQAAKAVAKDEAMAKAAAKAEPRIESRTEANTEEARLTASPEEDDNDISGATSSARSQKTPKPRVEISKPPLKVGVDWQPIPRTIVEADDDDFYTQSTSETVASSHPKADAAKTQSD